MFTFIRNLRAKRLRDQLFAQQVSELVEESRIVSWWQAALDMLQLRDELNELEELLLEAQYAEDWAAASRVEHGQRQVRSSIHALLPSYTQATIELGRRNYALPV